MTVQYYGNDKIHNNPYQARAVAPADVVELANSIAVYGLKHIPCARPHPELPGHVQLIEGHRRRVAWFMRSMSSQAPMPLEVIECSDRDMFERNVIENFQREDLNPIQRAMQIRAYIDAFTVSQEDAARLFGLGRQGSVSNVLRLLELPEPIRELVANGQLSERLGRSLVVPSRIDAKETIKIVAEAVKDAKDDAAQLAYDIAQDIGNWAYRKGKQLNRAPWDLKTAIKVNLTGQAEARTCAGCAFAMKSAYGHEMCMQPNCFAAKLNQFAADDVARASKRLGIPLLKGGVEYSFIWNGEPWELNEKVKRWVKDKLPHLRLDIYRSKDGIREIVREVLGTYYAALYTVDDAWWNKQCDALDKQKKKNKAPVAHELDYAEVRAEEEGQEAQIESMIAAIAPAILSALPRARPIWELMEAGESEFISTDSSDASTTKGRLGLVRTYVWLWLREEGALQDEEPVVVARHDLLELAKLFKIRKLPKGWDAALNVEPGANGKTPASSRAKGKKK